MSIRLHPRNKEIGDFNISSGYWSHLLGVGVGLCIGYTRGLEPGQFVYQIQGKTWRDPVNGGGYRIKASQAKLMSIMTLGYLVTQETKRTLFNALSVAEQEERIRYNHDHIGIAMYDLPMHQEFIDACTKFVEWAAKSGGFSIN